MCDFWGPLGSDGAQNGAKIAQVVPKYRKKTLPGPPKDGSWNRLASRIAFGALLDTILVDFGWILDES